MCVCICVHACVGIYSCVCTYANVIQTSRLVSGCCPEDLPRAMNDREEWRERVRDILATSAI